MKCSSLTSEEIRTNTENLSFQTAVVADYHRGVALERLCYSGIRLFCFLGIASLEVAEVLLEGVFISFPDEELFGTIQKVCSDEGLQCPRKIISKDCDLCGFSRK
ncbi:hypothetical protein R1flu_006146 [Riccia fluitans]|uniref:Uncharacterized protein n=1 Tax=Riccia fluitans TaxID=41844 RepID=A0ABD1YV69_9MARC